MSTMVIHQPSVLVGAVPLFAVNRVRLDENYELPHLWGRRLGDEAAAGIWLAPESVNTGEQARAKGALEVLAQNANQAVAELRFKVTGKSFPWDALTANLHGHHFLSEITYEFVQDVPARRSARSRSASVHLRTARRKCPARRCSSRSGESRIKGSSECPN
jgi:hypothetical protein